VEVQSLRWQDRSILGDVQRHERRRWSCRSHIQRVRSWREEESTGHGLFDPIEEGEIFLLWEQYL
jgi:hypothetical protein